MNTWAKSVVTKYVNVGTSLVLMGALWLYLWVFPWYPAYVQEPHWGHNYAEALAFLAVGLAYFNRRLISDLLAFVAAHLIILASLELLPHPVTAVAGDVLVGLIILDMIAERGRKVDGQHYGAWGWPSSRRLRFWLRNHLLTLSYLLLGHLSLIYFLVRLPAGTYETDLVTIVYDLMLIPFVGLAMLERPVKTLWNIPTAYLGFFWGMLTMVISLILLINQPETWVCLGTVVGVSVVAMVALSIHRISSTEK